MANVAGFFEPVIGWPYGDLRPTWYAQRSFGETNGWAITISSPGAARTNTQPVDEIPANRAGNGAFDAGYGAIWYNRIHIVPDVINVGNLITEKVSYVEVWNGFFTSKNFQSLNGTNVDGISISGSLVIPSTVKPLQSFIYTVTVGTAGSTTIDGAYTWTVDGENSTLGIVGTRIIVFPFISNWASQPTESLSWLTSVERAYSGDEQRARWRDSARKELDYEVLIADGQDAARLENIMFGWQSRKWAVPIVTDRSSLTAPASIGDTILYLNTTNLGFYAGMSAILRTDTETYEAAEISSVTTGALLLVRGVTQAWASGTPVFPGGIAQMSASQPITRLSDRYIRSNFSWRFNVDEGVANTPDAAAALTYQDQEVFLIKPNWVENPTFTFQDSYETFGDNGSGLLEFEQTSDWPTILRRARYDFISRSQILDFRKFLARRAGRWAPCWIPSWNDDFQLIEDANSNATYLKVNDTNYRNFVENHPARRNIAIFRRSTSTPLMVQISYTQVNLDGSVNLVLSAPVGTTLEMSDVSKICHMNLFRLASDQVTLTWETTTVATVVLNWLMVKA